MQPRTIEQRVTALEAETRALRDALGAAQEASRRGDEESRRHTRLLYEDLIARMALLDEGRDR